MSYYHIIKIIFVNPQMEYAWPLETDTAKKFPDPIKYKYVNKFYHEKESVVKIGEFLQAFWKRNLIRGVSGYRPDRKAAGKR